MSSATLIYPFDRLFRDLTVAIDTLRIDGETAPIEAIDQKKRTIEISGLRGPNWNIAALDVTVGIPIQEIKNRGGSDGNISVLLRLTCDATDLRSSDLLEIHGDEARGKVSFNRDLVAGRLSLTAFLCELRSDGIPRIIKESQPWTVIINEARASNSQRPPRPPFPGRGLQEFFNVQWRKFSDEDALRSHVSELYFVDVSASPPIIFLNDGIEKYRALLTNQRTSSRDEQAMRELEYRRISLGAWFAAGLHALEGVRIDENTQEVTLPDGWRRDVLDLILKRMRPNESVEVTARNVAWRRHDGEGYALVLGELQTCVNAMLGTTSSLRRYLNWFGSSRRDEVDGE